MKSRPFLVYPCILFLLIFTIDKVFLLPIFHEEFLQAGNSVFYHQRKVLRERLSKDEKLKETKLALVFGDSRSYPYSEIGIPEKERKDWSLYNFSGPQGIPMYSYISLKRILDSGIKPNLVILSLSPEAFDDTKGFIGSPFLRMGCDSECRDIVWNDIPLKNKWEYVLDKLFAIRSVELNLSLFFSRLKSGKMKEYKALYNQEFQLVNYSKGEYLMYATTANPVEKLKKDTARVTALYMRSFTLGESQFPYVKKLIDLANENGFQLMVVWPKVYGEYYKFYEKYDIANIWWAKIIGGHTQKNVTFLNMNEKNSCDLFNDASHQSVFCFVEQMDLIWRIYAEKSAAK